MSAWILAIVGCRKVGVQGNNENTDSEWCDTYQGNLLDPLYDGTDEYDDVEESWPWTLTKMMAAQVTIYRIFYLNADEVDLMLNFIL